MPNLLRVWDWLLIRLPASKLMELQAMLLNWLAKECSSPQLPLTYIGRFYDLFYCIFIQRWPLGRHNQELFSCRKTCSNFTGLRWPQDGQYAEGYQKVNKMPHKKATPDHPRHSPEAEASMAVISRHLWHFNAVGCHLYVLLWLSSCWWGSGTKYDCSTNLCLGDVRVNGCANPQYLEVSIKASKIDHGVSVFLGVTISPLCPIAAILNYMAIRGVLSLCFNLSNKGAVLFIYLLRVYSTSAEGL